MDAKYEFYEGCTPDQIKNIVDSSKSDLSEAWENSDLWPELDDFADYLRMQAIFPDQLQEVMLQNPGRYYLLGLNDDRHGELVRKIPNLISYNRSYYSEAPSSSGHKTWCAQLYLWGIELSRMQEHIEFLMNRGKMVFFLPSSDMFTYDAKMANPGDEMRLGATMQELHYILLNLPRIDPRDLIFVTDK